MNGILYSPTPNSFPQGIFTVLLYILPQRFIHTKGTILHSVALRLAFSLKNICCGVFNNIYIYCILFKDLIVCKMQQNITKCLYSIACMCYFRNSLLWEVTGFQFICVYIIIHCKFCTYILKWFFKNIYRIHF